MKRNYNRKTTPKVKDGTVIKKNNHAITALQGYVVDRERPDKGYKHVIKKKEIHDFIEIIPNWDEISLGIESIVLDSGDNSFDGLYRHFSHENTGIIWLSAWPEKLWVNFDNEYFTEHKWHFDSIGLKYEKENEEWICYFTEFQAKTFMLMHIFLHEMGHHVDKLRSKNKNQMLGGEEFAENFANKMFEEIWPIYSIKFR